MQAATSLLTLTVPAEKTSMLDASEVLRRKPRSVGQCDPTDSLLWGCRSNSKAIAVMGN